MTESVEQFDVESHRAGFEAWAQSKDFDLAREGVGYRFGSTDRAWAVWIAAKREASTEPSALTETEIECMWHEACLKHLDMDDSAIPEFARAIESKVAARFRAEGGNTCNEPESAHAEVGFPCLCCEGNSGAAQGDALDAP